MKPLDDHELRVEQELNAAGMTKYGHLKFASRYLPTIIRQDEHIKGVVYGRYAGGEAQLVATDRRVIFLDKKPLIISSDEIAYEAVTGTTHSAGGLFAGVTLHTKLGNYQLRYVNKTAAERFVSYVEDRIEHRNRVAPEGDLPVLEISENAQTFLLAHDICVLSTIDRLGNISGAAVYYTVEPGNVIYILTRSGTTKARNMQAHQQVAVTVVEEETARILQLQGLAEAETDEALKRKVTEQLTKRRSYWYHEAPPPVMQLEVGEYVVYRIMIIAAAYHAYRGAPRLDVPTSETSRNG